MQWHCSERDLIHIVAIARALSDAQQFMGTMSFGEFAASDGKQNAVAMAVARCGAHVKQLSQEFRNAEPGITWQNISAMRDWIIHDYDGLDFEKLYYAVTAEAPHVLAILQPYIEPLTEIKQESADPFNVPSI